jgi:hypothetical protein
MATSNEPLRTIVFWRGDSRVDPDAFTGVFSFRGTHFEGVRPQYSDGPIPEYALAAVQRAIARLESGASKPHEQAVEALKAVSDGVVYDG